MEKSQRQPITEGGEGAPRPATPKEIPKPSRESIEKAAQKAKSDALRNYFLDYPFIKGSSKREPPNDALEGFHSYRIYIEKARSRGLSNKEIIELARGDYMALESQYGTLLRILPSRDRKNFPAFKDGVWSLETQEAFVQKNFFIREEQEEKFPMEIKEGESSIREVEDADSYRFINRAQNILIIAKQIETALGTLARDLEREKRGEEFIPQRPGRDRSPERDGNSDLSFDDLYPRFKIHEPAPKTAWGKIRKLFKGWGSGEGKEEKEKAA